MADAEFMELAGRIEGLSRAFLMLSAHLDKRGALNGERFSDALLDASEKVRFPGEHLLATQRTLRELSKSLDEICSCHQEPDGQS